MTSAERKENKQAILLAEDSSVQQLVIVRQLKKLGYTNLTTVSNGQEAMAMVKAYEYALILMDCEMPILDGFEATLLIRDYEFKLGRHTPIIAVSGHSFDNNAQRYLEKGMDDCLIKPIKIEELKILLEKYLS
ncbi:response regulator [Heliorestis acidaminivorans]|uniref:Stage 0 sporulation protein A homolog n=1 Tax=Heliorestis acidaminivorans TaxID=553427 RepID=A0A6I0ETP0_9FIRM|nr:response regulator [Heliorestis acidaminivorans]KAB2954155.1 response regulator [Heliorestis acidaminivorans]